MTIAALRCKKPIAAVGIAYAAQEVAEVLVHLGHPVGGEQVLVLPGDRTLEPHHRIHPRGVLRLDAELRVSAVLTATVRHGVIDHSNLAVVPQVDAPAERPEQHVTDR